MKIALPSNGDQIDSHFGQCRFFTILTIDQNKVIISSDRYVPPSGCGCKNDIASKLAEKGVSVMIAGTMGDTAHRELLEKGIKVVRGCAGHVHEVAELWLAGEITSGGCSCAAHEGCASL